MDLGATVHAAQPALRHLSLHDDLPGPQARHRRGAAAARAPKAQKPTRRGLAFVLARKDGAILLRKRPAKGLLGGMDEVPSTPWREGKFTAAEALAEAPVPARWQILDGLVRHTFTHFHLELTVARATATTRSPGQARARHKLGAQSTRMTERGARPR